MTMPHWLEADVNLLFEEQQVAYIRIVLVKVRQKRNLSRREVAELIGVGHYRITEFEDNKQPWSTITMSFLQRYARAVGVKLEVGFLIPGEDVYDAGNTPDEDGRDRGDPVDGG